MVFCKGKLFLPPAVCRVKPGNLVGAIANEAVGDERILAFNAADGSYAVYYYLGATADGALAAGELTLLSSGTTATLVAADFVFA